MIETAYEDLSITPEQLRQELEARAEIPDVVSGTLTPKALKTNRWHIGTDVLPVSA
jgi:hypothetical protein